MVKVSLKREDCINKIRAETKRNLISSDPNLISSDPNLLLYDI